VNAQPQPPGAGSAAPAGAGASTAGTPSVDARHPWLGLASFTEETRGYFYGRDEEIAELARRVQRKLLTILFGQSGLGKTSILQAGLVPRLRDAGYCPIYVRIGYGPETPEPSEQIKQSIMRTSRRAGAWTQVGVAETGESLWEFLHHRDDVLLDEAGKPLIPLLIFDQFEEIFTLGQTDDFGRARAATFIADLADLVENRAPRALEARIESDESLSERFDFARSDYRVLISLREDYLAPLEGLKTVMPSITQNRLRLAPMTGAQAMDAVLRPGKGLVSEEVAAAIVRFVAGGAELANAEVEPSLLSLICRELNDTRIAQGRSEISLDLLAGSHATILSNFYERALADQPPEVRRVIEDDLLTASGFRENVAEESLVERLKEAGAAPGTLPLLVNRRLLRIEERLDTRRVELTHDVLCSVVKYSRDQRHEREARESTERMLAEQRERELAARRALVRARQVAAVCIVLALGAVVAAVIAVISTRRAHQAEQQAVQARAGAEHLLGYLTDDFVHELESFGRLDVVAEFAKRQIDYFHSLPASLKGPDTVRNGALAMVHYARAKRVLGDPGAAAATASEALSLLEQRRGAGDTSDPDTIALALAYATKAQIGEFTNDPNTTTYSGRAAELLKPLAEGPNATAAAKRAYVDVLVRVGFEQLRSAQYDKAESTTAHAAKLAESLGARDLSDYGMAAFYTEASAWRVESLVSQGRLGEARRVAEDAIALADKLLAQRPGYRLALHAQQLLVSDMGGMYLIELNPLQAVGDLQRAVQISLTQLELDPGNMVTTNNLSVARGQLGGAHWSAGQLREALPFYDQALKDAQQITGAGANLYVGSFYNLGQSAFAHAQIGDFDGAGAIIDSGKPYMAKLRTIVPPGSFVLAISDMNLRLSIAGVAFQRADYPPAQRIAGDVVRELGKLQPKGGIETQQWRLTMWFSAVTEGPAAYFMHDYAASETALRAALEAKRSLGSQGVDDQRILGGMTTWLTMAVAREGRTAEAAKLIAPVVKFERGLAARNHGDAWIPVELASALYAQSLTDRAQAPALHREALALLDSVPAEMRNIHDVKIWREFIAADGGAAH
jgi:tetratricopeptide (TPR) repeat protein